MAIKKITIKFDDDFKTHYEGMDSALEVTVIAHSQMTKSIGEVFEL